MKCAMTFTVVVVVGLAIISGAPIRQPRATLITPRLERAPIGNPLAPAGVARNLPKPGSLVDEVRQAQQPDADPNGEFTTTGNEPVVPGEYNGDVRDLPQLGSKDGSELDLDGPLNLRDILSDKEAGAAPRDMPDVVNNVAPGPMPSPLQSFQGLSLSDSCSGSPCGIGFPADSNGDVGLNYYIEAVNEGLAIFSKANGSRAATFSEDSLWSSANTGTPCDNHAHGDPVIVYDQFADHWIISNFAFGFDSTGYPTTPFYECFAVSKTGDPLTGGWWFYPLRTDSGATNQPPPSTLADYPKIGNWNDGCLYMSANEFSFPSGRFIGTLFASINKADMESGQPLTSSIGFVNNGSSPFSLLPSNISGARTAASLPPAGTPNYFVSQSMDSYSFEVRKFTPGTSPKICGAGGSLSAPAKVAQAVFTSPDVVSQRDTSVTLQSLGERLMQKVQYRKVNGTESLWVVHSVQSAANTPVRPGWAQINVTGGSVRTTATQQQIYTPDTTFERWVPSIAADHDGNVALGYNISSSATFPSIAYAGRLASDPANQMPQGEVQLVAGNGSQRNNCQGGPCTRWGDYSAMSVDPQDDCTFWFVGEYYDSQSNGDAGNWQTRIGSFRFPSCGGQTLIDRLTLTSQNPNSGVTFNLTPDDTNSQGDGTTPFTRTYAHGQSATLTAPKVVGGTVFQKWQRDGVDWSINPVTTAFMDGSHTMTAVYVTPQNHTLTVASDNPGSGVSINVSPNDTNNAGSGTTQFNRVYANNGVVNLTAPATAGGNNFQKWQRDGVDVATTASTTVTMDADHLMTAFYIPPAPVSVTVGTNPAGLSFTVDGTSYNSSQTFTWAPGSNHTVGTNSTQSGPTATQYAWGNWSDGGSITHTVSATSSKTYTANFTTQYLLTLINGDGGVIHPITGFYNAGQTVNISATTVDQFRFDGWTGTGPGSLTTIFKSITVRMDGPVTETANFSVINTTLQYSAATYTAKESDGFVNITVTRDGDTKSTLEVAYTTGDGTAKEGRNYIAAKGVLTFGKGDVSKTFPVLIIDNAYADGPTTVNLSISDISGGFFGPITSSVLTLSDNDSAPGPNPVDDPRSFVQFNYYDFLARYPDSSGWDFWTNEIKSCGSDSSCVAAKRVNVSAAFFLSIEYQQTGYEVERFYKAAYGDANGNSTNGGTHQLPVPTIRFSDFLRDTELIGRGLVVLQSGWEQQLEHNKQVYADLFIRTSRFVQAYPATLTPDQFVDQLNQNAGKVLSPDERTAAINLFSGGNGDSSNLTARAQALRQVADDPDLVAAERNRAFVLTQYFGYLRRNPDDAPEPTRDYTGYDFWLSKLNQFNGDYVNAQMVKAFITSSEYRQRFGQQ